MEESFFKESDSPEEIQEEIDNFIQNTLSLMDNHIEL